MKRIWILTVILPYLFLLGCTRVPLVRTLPEYVYSVYVPMAENNTYEPGLEELLTNHIIDEFLADGRLRVENKANADITVSVSIKKYNTKTSSFSSDDFPMMDTATVVAGIYVVNNLDDSIMSIFDDIIATHTYVSDPRRIVSDVEPNVKNTLMNNLANLIVQNVISGPYEAQ